MRQNSVKKKIVYLLYGWGLNGILLPKFFLPTVRKNRSSDRENF